MTAPAFDTRALHHSPQRVLTIRGKSFCNSACVFCVEKFTSHHPVAPKVDETRQLIVEGAGKYDMLHFMNGEPSLHPKLFDYVALAKAEGYRYFGMSSHFRAFADPKLALRVVEAGFEFFDISLHAATRSAQLEVNPLDDDGDSLKEALHGLRNVYEVARRLRKAVAVTHKVVITKLNVEHLVAIFEATYRFGVRNFIFQPVKVSGLDPELAARIAISEDEILPHVNELLRRTRGSGAELKLYGLSQVGVSASPDLVQETNLIRHIFSRKNRPQVLSLRSGDRLVPAAAPASDAAFRSVTVQLPTMAETATFACREDEPILNAALREGVTLPFGCRMGSCGMCCGRVVDGTVEQRGPGILTDAQLTDGYRLLCRSTPRSDVVLVTHQDNELGL